MKLRHPFFVRLAALFGSWLIRFWISTLRYHIGQWDSRVHPTDGSGQHYVYAFWHETILLACYYRTPVHALVSTHADGEFIARICQHLTYRTVRGSSTRGGVRAIWDMLRAAQETNLMVTPDGPKGPRRQVQLGMIFAASRTGLPIVPVGVFPVDGWRANSWDQHWIPCPGSLVYTIWGQAIHIPPDLDRAGLEYYRRLVEQAMHDVTAATEEWARTGVMPPPPLLPGSKVEWRQLRAG